MLNVDAQSNYSSSTSQAVSTSDLHAPHKDPFDAQIQVILSNTGSWTVDHNGVRRISPRGKLEIACYHQILPTGRLHNITTDTIKINLVFRRAGQPWKTITVEKGILASTRSIISLADRGIGVTSNCASYLVEYLNEMYEIHYHNLEKHICVSHLGFFPHVGFVPYTNSVTLNVDTSYATIRNAIRERGNQAQWIHTASECRAMSKEAQIMLAGSFASPLVSIIGGLPFFIHIWGIDSGTGKTVTLMLAASIWGDPELGRYIQTHNATSVGHERIASFLYHLPLCIDELQLACGKRRPNIDVYQLAQGVGKSRGHRNGGLEITPTWSCTILSTGESPIVSAEAGSGAVNRVIEIGTEPDHYIIKDGQRVANMLRQNYGFAGKIFVDNLLSSDASITAARERYQRNCDELKKMDITDKQAMAAAILLTADQLAAKWIFHDEVILIADDLRPYLISKTDVSAGKRAYEWLCGWVASNSHHFHRGTLSPSGITYGMLDTDIAYIIRQVFNQALQDAGFSPSATLSYLRANNLIMTRDNKGYTKSKRINGIATDCVWMVYQKNDHI